MVSFMEGYISAFLFVNHGIKNISYNLCIRWKYGMDKDPIKFTHVGEEKIR